MTHEEKLRAFAREMLHEWWSVSEFDGGDLQETALRHGLLEPVTVTEACGEHCGCAEMGNDFPTTCYRMTDVLTYSAVETRTDHSPICVTCSIPLAACSTWTHAGLLYCEPHYRAATNR